MSLRSGPPGPSSSRPPLWRWRRGKAVISAIFLTALPMITVNIWEGAKAIDKELLEMGIAFKADRGMIVKDIILPQLVPYLFASIRYGFALAWKMVVAEMLGQNKGIGFMMNYSFGVFSMEGVLAWTIAFTMVMIILEYAIFRLLERRATRWRPVVTLW